nr:ATP-binding protein [Campylobacterota bacterium]
GEGNLFFKNKQGVRFSIDDLSTGEKTLLSKVLYLFFQGYKDKVILIDEPELSLHPSWQNKVLKIYENFAIKNNCQIIIATHSPHIIGSAKNEYIRILRKNEDGNIEVINDVKAYGRDIEWVLEEMGVEDTRLPKIVKRFDEIQKLINNEEFDKADEALDKLEYVIGDNDKDILALRNDLAFERMDFEEDN